MKLRSACPERLLLAATLVVQSAAAAAQDALHFAMDEAQAELAARKSWAARIPPVSQVSRRGKTLRIGIGTPLPSGSTQWREWWKRALCAAPELRKILQADGAVQVYPGAEPTEDQEVFMSKVNCIASDGHWVSEAIGSGPGYQVAPPPPAPAPPPSIARPLNFKTKKIPSRLPLSLTVPDTFSDVTGSIHGTSAPAGWAMYCDPADAQLARDQYFGKRVEEPRDKGCIIIARDPSSTYSATERRFSVEKDIEAMNKWPPSREPRFEVKNHSLIKREVRGVPILAFVQDSVTTFGSAREYFLYVGDGSRVWLITLVAGKQEDLSASIWDALLSGLE